MLTTEDRQKRALQHARWRVDFLLCLLEVHRRLPAHHDPEWVDKETGYIMGLAAAQAELDLCEFHADLAKLKKASSAEHLSVAAVGLSSGHASDPAPVGA